MREPIRDYFIIENPQALDALADYKERFDKFREDALAFMKSVGASNTYQVGDDKEMAELRIYAVEFEGDAPKGWKVTKRDSCVPNLKTVEGREFYKRMKQMTCKADSTIFKLMDCSCVFYVDGSHSYLVSARVIPQLKVLARPRPEKETEVPKVEGFRRIETWEFEKMVFDYNQARKTDVDSSAAEEE